MHFIYTQIILKTIKTQFFDVLKFIKQAIAKTAYSTNLEANTATDGF